MKLDFYKYQGAGNDFILFDNRHGFFPQHNRTEIIQWLCARNFGVGSDGLMLLQRSNQHAFYLIFFNPDSSQSFCGNGSRCAVLFAFHMGWCKSSGSFDSPQGVHHFEVLDEQTVKLSMNNVSKAEVEMDDTYSLINTGSPHYILDVDDLSFDVVKKGREIRYNDRFSKAGVNVNFVQTKDAQAIALRTYERGVENETLACGTGVTACAIHHALKQHIQGFAEIKVAAKGGDLMVQFDANATEFTNVFLIGPAQFVFKGEINV
jgi:diaminopimelate epimerase